MPAASLSAEEVVEEVVGKMAPWLWAVAEVPMTPTLNQNRCQVLALPRWWERVRPCPRSDPTAHVGAWTRDLAARGDAAAVRSLSPRVSP
jgi:hypothetical protein